MRHRSYGLTEVLALIALALLLYTVIAGFRAAGAQEATPGDRVEQWRAKVERPADALDFAADAEWLHGYFVPGRTPKEMLLCFVPPVAPHGAAGLCQTIEAKSRAVPCINRLTKNGGILCGGDLWLPADGT